MPTGRDMLTAMLANIAEGLRQGRDALTERRRAICLGSNGADARCPEIKSVNSVTGRIRCRLCGCEDPARDRPRCPAFRW